MADARAVGLGGRAVEERQHADQRQPARLRARSEPGRQDRLGDHKKRAARHHVAHRAGGVAAGERQHPHQQLERQSAV